MKKEGFLAELGFLVFRLRESKADNEFLIYDLPKKTYNRYGRTRAVSFLTKEIQHKGINLADFRKEKGIETDKKNNELIGLWLEEEYVLIDNIGYKPEAELIFSEDSQDKFNIYQKSTLLKNFIVGNSDEFPNIKKFFMNVVGHNETSYIWFMQWLAHTLKFPHEKVLTAVILQGEQGTGKTVICSKILQKIFQNNYVEIGQAQISSEFNGWAFGRQLIVANEVIHCDNKLIVPDKIKILVTDEIIPLRVMQTEARNVKNYSRVIFNSNHIIPLKLERTDRRYSVFKSKALGKKGLELWQELSKNFDRELNSFVSYLYSLEIDKMLINVPCETEARKDLIRNNQNSIEEFVSTSQESGGFTTLAKHYNDMLSPGNQDETNIEEYYSYVKFNCISKDGKKYVETRELYNLYLRFCQDYGYKNSFSRSAFTRQLKFMGHENELIRVEKSVYRATDITEVEA